MIYLLLACSLVALFVLGLDRWRINETHNAVMEQQIEIARAEAFDKFSRMYLRPSGFTARVQDLEVPVYFAIAPVAIHRTMSVDTVELVKDGVGMPVKLTYPAALLDGDTVFFTFPPSRNESDYVLKT